MSSTKKLNMQKRGFIDGFSLVAFIVVSLGVAGATLAFLTPEEAKLNYNFVGDVTTSRYYDTSCLEKIPQENRLLFDNISFVESLNYTYHPCIELK